MSAPRVHVLRLLAAHGLRPDTDLGQHFLVDENLVDVAVREAGVTGDDVVFEVGAGPGVLTAALCRHAAWVHTAEVDPRLGPVLDDALAGARNVDVHWGDAMALPWEDLRPAPTVLVSNLPYHIATPVMVESTWRLPGVERWCVMTQREVADRWMAPAGDPLYGAPSVLLQLACAPAFRRNVGRDVFVPPPRVDSALVAFTRRGPGADARVRRCVRAAFGQRRKTLRNTLGAAGADRDRVVAALTEMGCPPGARAEHLTPERFPELTERLRWPEP
ncbi:MAG: 16S rRNA (adenine(1518)-N(6)/adenine(1519)-N(6))-dimethyltransferase RsmA [Thermoleophilia bacterium]